MRLSNTLRVIVSAVMLTGVFGTGVKAQDSALIALETRQATEGWAAVGRLDVRGKGFCTAALIRDRLILTAAHCLFDADGNAVAADRFSFRAGLRDGRAEATRGVIRAVPHPEYAFRDDATDAPAVALDIAVLELDRPIRVSRLIPYQIAPRPLRGDAVRVVSYARGREDAPSLEKDCSVLGRDLGVVVMTCDVDFGSSGSPVFMRVNGEMRIVSVVSAMAQLNGQRVALGTSLDGPLNALLSHFTTLGPARPGGTQRLINRDERNDTGAKFVRP